MQHFNIRLNEINIINDKKITMKPKSYNKHIITKKNN